MRHKGFLRRVAGIEGTCLLREAGERLVVIWLVSSESLQVRGDGMIEAPVGITGTFQGAQDREELRQSDGRMTAVM
ncbi:MAG: hypothetical protein A3H44_13300 [Gammaproteobacteria bacterium RIFCSPLOWO2_02_FULL_57_10]|nr:MAG: hypothetical protein A3H44_13300 [Gammaproteobacteria bacterium RIFCSPLOWO2_02_FULL_57_10]